MAFGVGKKQEPPAEEPAEQEQADEDGYTSQDASDFQKMIKSKAGIKTLLEMDEWSFDATNFDDAIEAAGIVKEMAMSKLSTEVEKRRAEVLFEIFQRVKRAFPKQTDLIKDRYARFLGYLMLRCSDRGWARELMKTTHYALTKRAEDSQKQDRKPGVV